MWLSHPEAGEYSHADGPAGEVPLERLSVDLGDDQHDPDFLLKVLGACPHLLSLEVSSMHLPSGHSQKVLLNTIAGKRSDVMMLRLHVTCDCSDAYPTLPVLSCTVMTQR